MERKQVFGKIARDITAHIPLDGAHRELHEIEDELAPIRAGAQRRKEELRSMQRQLDALVGRRPK